MKKAEKILVIIGAAGIALKFFLIPGGDILTILSFSFLSLLYFLLGFALFNDIPLRNIFKKQSYQGISKLRITGSVFTGYALFQIVFGILCRIQFYAGTFLLLITGIFWMAIIFIVTLIQLFKTKDIFYKGVMMRIVIFGFAGYVLSVMPRWRMAEAFYPDYPAYVQALKNLNDDPDNKELEDKVEQERQLMLSDDKGNKDK